MENLRKTGILLVLTLCTLLFAFSTNVTAQNAPELKFRHITVENGLSCNNVTSLIQDKYGFIWIGTDNGLNRYDGHNIKFPRGHRTGVSVHSLHECGDSIMIGCNVGLLYYCQRTDSVYAIDAKTHMGNSISSTVTGIQHDYKGGIWVSTVEQGIFYLSRSGELKNYPMPNHEYRVADILVTKDNEVYAFSNWCTENLARYNKKMDRFEPIHLKFAEGEKDVRVKGITLAEDNDRNIWLGTWNDGLIRFNAKTLDAKVVVKSSNDALTHVHWVTPIDKDYIYVSSDEGLCIYNKKSGNISQLRDDELNSFSLCDKFIYPILQDKEGGIWVGSYYGGLDYAHPEKANFRNYTRSDYKNSVNGNIISNFREDADANIWIASDDGGLSVFNKKTRTFYSYDKNANGRTRNVHGLHVDGYKLYIGTYTDGVYVMDTKTGQEKHYPHLIDKLGNDLGTSSYSICKDRQGRVWVGTFTEILTLDEEKGIFEQRRQTDANVIDIDEGKGGNMWFATDGGGLFRYNDKTKKWFVYNSFYNENNDNSSKPITSSMFVDEKGELWVGTSNGLFVYDQKADSFLCKPLKGLYPSVVGVTGYKGMLYLATSLGVVEYEVKSESVKRIYASGDGIDNINFVQNAIFASTNGTVFVGTSHGYVSFQPKRMKHNSIVPRPVFTNIELFNQAIKVGSEHMEKNINEVDHIELSHDENSLRIYFSAMSYLMPDNNMYQYYLEGYEKTWNAPTHEHSVTYTNLAPGEYVLHVRASNNDGVWSTEDATLKIVVNPPFYWNTPVKCIYFLLIVGIIYAGVHYLLRKKEKKFVAEIEEITEQKEHEVHEARIKFMTISDSDNEFLKKLEDVIEKNFSNPEITVDFLASEMNVSRSGLFAKVKTLADVTPNEMIQIIRLKHAARLLETKEYRVNEICYMVGFNSPSYFTKCFTKHYGVKPAEYAK